MYVCTYTRMHIYVHAGALEGQRCWVLLKLESQIVRCSTLVEDFDSRSSARVVCALNHRAISSDPEGEKEVQEENMSVVTHACHR